MDGSFCHYCRRANCICNKPVMRVAIVGSRNFAQLEKVQQYVLGLDRHAVVVSGGARGVDTVATDAASSLGMSTLIIKADWERYGKSAGFIRNGDIVDVSDKVVAFWDGKSRGTKHTIDIARKQGKPVEIITEDSACNQTTLL